MLENQTDVPIYLASVSLFDLTAQPGRRRMIIAGWGVIGADDGVIQRPILIGFGEQLSYPWLEIAPHQKVWASWVLIPPFGAPVKLSESSVSRTGGNANFKPTWRSTRRWGRGSPTSTSTSSPAGSGS